MGRRAERTYFNTEYMPELYEDAIESDDPQKDERRCHGHLDDVVKADEARFRKLCKQYDFDWKQLKQPKRKRQ